MEPPRAELLGDKKEKVPSGKTISSMGSGTMSRKQLVPKLGLDEEVKILNRDRPVKCEQRMVEDPWTDYEMVKKLGNGGYGTVVSVKDKKTGEALAMKKMTRMRAEKDYGERFWKEVEILSQLDHPSVLKFHDAFGDKEFYFLISELLTGGELLDFILKSTRFSEQSASILLSQMLKAIKYLHENNVVHLDLKPENYVFSAPETDPLRRLKLIDFGCSQFVKDDEISSAKTGTPYYIAPEMLSSSVTKTGKILKACDMWSLGVVSFVLVTGRLPFFGDSRKAILQAVVRGTYSFPTDVTLSTMCKEFISKLLEKNFSARMTVHDALAHPWIDDIAAVSTEPLEPVVKSGIRNCHKDTNLKRAVGALLVHEISPQDKEELQKLFTGWDDNKDGVLEISEVVGMLQRLGYDPHSAVKVAATLIKEFDLDKDGNINLGEFSAIGTRGMLAGNEKFVQDLFKYLDKDANGSVTKEEIEIYFAEYPNFKLEMDIMDVIRECDLNRDGTISLQEFLQAMKSRDSRASFVASDVKS